MGHAEACGCDRAWLAILQRLLDGASPDLLVRGDDAHSEVGEQACGLHRDEEAVADTHLLIQLGTHREICPQYQPGGGGLQLVDRLAPSLVGEWRDARHAVQHEGQLAPALVELAEVRQGREVEIQRARTAVVAEGIVSVRAVLGLCILDEESPEVGTLCAVGIEYQLADDTTALILAHVVTGRYGQDDVVGLALSEAQGEVVGKVEDTVVEGHIDPLLCIPYA